MSRILLVVAITLYVYILIESIGTLQASKIFQ